MAAARALVEFFARRSSASGSLARGPRALLVVAHPDDETVGAGGMLAAIDPLVIVVVTDGAPRDPWFRRAAGVERRKDYAALRWRELEAALSAGGLPPERAVGWDIVDQEAAYALEGLTLAVFSALEVLHPDVVLTHPYEGGHPDHDATAFAVHTARRMLPEARRPALLELAYYHEGPDGTVWGRFAAGDPGREIELCAEELGRKRAMLACYRSQAPVLGRFPVASERVRAAPEYDFRAPPPARRFHYDSFGWALTGSEFVLRTSAAARRL